ncbi:MAG: dTDP-4-dehydrorhamnose reductase [Saprospiraceae bacterium]
MSENVSRKPVIIVTGAMGQVGSAIRRISESYPQWDFHFYSKKELDISDAAIMRNTINFPFDYIINAAAFTAVDKAETEAELAFQINERGAANVAQICVENQAGLLHLSSDYVYHNSLNRPIVETDPAAPQGVYAKSKLAGDTAILQIHHSAIVMRTSWVYSQDGHNFVKTMLKLGKDRDQMRVVKDQIGKPTWAQSIAEAISIVLHRHFLDTAIPGGIYNFADGGECTWYDFALEIFALANPKVHVEPINTDEFPTPATRPNYSILDTRKWENETGFVPNSWQENLALCLKQLKAAETM